MKIRGILVLWLLLLLPALAAQDQPSAKPQKLQAAWPSFLDTEQDILLAPDKAQEIFATILGQMKALKTLQARFLQIAPTGEQSGGIFYLDKARGAHFTYEPPSPLRIVANRKTLYLYNANLRTTDRYPVKETPLVFFFSNGLPEKTTLIGIKKNETTFEIAMRVKNDDLPFLLVVGFSATSLLPSYWIVRDARGQNTKLLLTEVVHDTEIPAKLFRPPEAGGLFLKDR